MLSKTVNTPLTPLEQNFIKYYVKCGVAVEALRKTGYECDDYYRASQAILDRPNVKMEIKRIMDEIRNDTIANATEVMTYFTSVMRGEVKDQFGLEAPLSERTKAAQEIAKRTIDIENRNAGTPDALVSVTLDWDRKGKRED